MYGMLKPGKVARLPGSGVSPHLAALVHAKRHEQPLEPIMLRVMKEFGFDSFMYGMSPVTQPLRKDARAYVWTTLPREWVRCYADKGYVEIDPRVTETYNRNVPLIWDSADYAGDSRYTQFFADAARFGIRSGVAVSFRDPDHGRMMCAFNSSTSPVSPERRTALMPRLGDVMLFSVSFHDFFMAHFVDHGDTIVTRGDPLSKRERQCLELAANGMTSIDIGSKLGITERTANFHFNNLIQKMGVLNRQEAIAVGIARGWVRVYRATLNAGDRRRSGGRHRL
jgi:LuxR family quorum-sensing system transcriptional regulator SolR